jgi:hypothetical protein
MAWATCKRPTGARCTQGNTAGDSQRHALEVPACLTLRRPRHMEIPMNLENRQRAPARNPARRLPHRGCHQALLGERQAQAQSVQLGVVAEGVADMSAT